MIYVSVAVIIVVQGSRALRQRVATARAFADVTQSITIKVDDGCGHSVATTKRNMEQRSVVDHAI